MDNNELIVLAKEFSDNLCFIVNHTELPAFIMRSLLRDLDRALQTKEQQEYQFALMMSGKGETENGNSDSSNNRDD